MAHVLFIDQPVGTGYSYVEDSSSFATSIDEAGDDLLVLLKGFYSKLPEFKVGKVMCPCTLLSYIGEFILGLIRG